MTDAWGDARLVREAQAGSPAAFSRLVDRHQQALRAFLRRACGDWALADDLAQEALLTAWTRLDRIDPHANVRAWLCGIGYNKCLTALRSDRRARAREAGWRSAEQTTPGLAPSDRLALERAMAGLPLEQRGGGGALPGRRLQPCGGRRGHGPAARHSEIACDARPGGPAASLGRI
jgi:RNA polymerase sigma-70 factor (ECF subfamily)